MRNSEGRSQKGTGGGDRGLLTLRVGNDGDKDGGEFLLLLHKKGNFWHGDDFGFQK